MFLQVTKFYLIDPSGAITPGTNSSNSNCLMTTPKLLPWEDEYFRRPQPLEMLSHCCKFFYHETTYCNYRGGLILRSVVCARTQSFGLYLQSLAMCTHQPLNSLYTYIVSIIHRYCSCVFSPAHGCCSFHTLYI